MDSKLTEQTILDIEKTKQDDMKETLVDVYKSLNDRGYKAQSQIVGYIITGDPAYIPRYNDARVKLTRYTREDLLNELLADYIK